MHRPKYLWKHIFQRLKYASAKNIFEKYLSKVKVCIGQKYLKNIWNLWKVKVCIGQKYLWKHILKVKVFIGQKYFWKHILKVKVCIGLTISLKNIFQRLKYASAKNICNLWKVKVCTGLKISLKTYLSTVKVCIGKKYLWKIFEIFERLKYARA